MSSHRSTARVRRPRLGLTPLEDRAVPAIFTCTVDPQQDMPGAVNELNRYLSLTTAQFYAGADTIRLFTGGTYVLGQGAGAGGSLAPIQPFGTKTDGTAEKTTNTLLTIDGRGATLTRAAEDKDERLMTIFGTADAYGRAVVSNLTLANGKVAAAGEGGGAVLVIGAPVTFDHVRFVGNQAQARGGAVAVSADAGENWTNNFTFCQFEGNVSGFGGGGLASFGGDDKVAYRVADSQFTGNVAGGNGGGMAVADNGATVERSSFSGNTAGLSGGAVSGSFGGGRRGLFVNSTFDGNTAAGKGGALNLFGTTTSSVVVAYNTITRNTAGGQGGGIYGELGENIRLNQNVIADNKVGKTDNDLSGDFTGDNPSQTRDLGHLNWLGVGTGFNTFAFGTTNKTYLSSLVGGTPDLGPLQNNGGPTLTRSPLPASSLPFYGGSSAYPDVLTAAPTTDQRGFSRSFGIGAYVVQGLFAGGDRVLVLDAGDKQVTASDTLFPTAVTVTLRDEYGQAVTTEPAVVRFQELSSGPFTTYPLGSAVTINPGATAASPGTGSAVLYAGANAAEGVIRITARTDSAPAANLTLYSRPPLGTVAIAAPASAEATVGAAYSPLSVTVTDASGAVVPNADVYFVVQLPRTGSGQNDPTANPSVSASGTFAGGDPAVAGQLVKIKTDANGVATAAFTAGTKAGTVTILTTAAATDANGAPLVLASSSVTLTNRPGPAARLVGPGQPDDTGADTSGDGQAVRVLEAASRPLVAVVLDAFGNPRPGDVVTFTNLDPTRAAGLSNSGGKATADDFGRAVFSPVANGKAELAAYTVRATAGGLTADFRLTNAAGLPATLTAAGGDGQSAAVSDPRVAAGATNQFAAPLRVRVLDAGGNPVPGALVSFSGGTSVRFVTSRVPADADGIATAVAATTDRAGTFIVAAQADTGSVATFTLVATPGLPAAVSVLSGGGQSARAGTPFAQNIVVRVVDQYQNPVPGVTPAVSGSGVAFTATPTDAGGLSTVTAVAGGTAGAVAGTVRVNTLPTVSFPLTVSGIPIDLNNPPPIVGLPALTAVGLDGGVASRVTVYNPDGGVRTQFAPFDPGFLGGSRVAVARAPLGSTVVVVPGPGRFPDAQVFNADTGEVQATFQPFEQTFTGGVYVATADVDRDGWEDYVFSPDQGGGPRVQIRSGKTGAVLQDFFGIDDPAFRGGVRTALGDVNGDKIPDLIVAAGFGGGPRIAVYDGKSLTGFRATPVKLMGDFFAFESTLRNGAYIAAGDVTGDGVADLVLGGGPGGGPRVRVLNGAELVAGRQTVVSDFFAGPSTDRGGVKVTVRELDENPAAAGTKGDIVTASGAGDGSRVSVYLGKDLRVGQPLAARGFDDLAGFRGGVFVG